jgi:predicted MPP superfamily phosphohydrolase
MRMDRSDGHEGRGLQAFVVPLCVVFCADALLGLLLLVSPSFFAIRRVYDFNTMIVPILFLCGAAIGWRRAQGRRDRVYACILATLAVMAVGVRVYATHIEPRCLRVRKVVIETPKVSERVRILHITDVQVAKVGSYERRAFAKMRELKPDLVLHTGDLLQVRPPVTVEGELPRLAELIRTLDPPLGTYGVDGDVDWRMRHASSDALGGLKILRNSQASIDVPGGTIRLFGLPLGASRGGTGVAERVADWLAQSETTDVTVVMGHSPDYAMDVMDLPVDLCLAGHTHGGQIRLPFIGPILTLSDVPRAWARGFREIGATRLNVSAGVGSEHKDGIPPIRWGCPPEMTVIDLIPATGNGEMTHEAR